MKDNMILDLKDFLDDSLFSYMELIRENRYHAFTRNRKVSPLTLMLQMFGQKGQTQKMELLNFYKDINQELDISQVGFYNARMKFNPEAIRVMGNDFMTNTYEKKDSLLVKLNEYLVTAVDGSDFIIPSTEENAELFGRNNDKENNPVMGKLSTIYDCINKVILDSSVGRGDSSEREHASKHLKVLKENIRQKTITIFDRGYYTMYLIDQMIESGQKFLFRLTRNTLNRYADTLSSGDDKLFEVTFDRAQSNKYRKNLKFRIKLLSTNYNLRIAKIPITNPETGEVSDEILLTNLDFNEFDMEGLKELYHLRWGIETAYNTLKNRMKFEEFSGYRSHLILQDIYTSVWLYNITMFQIIYTNKENEIPQERYKYQMKRNSNIAIGVIKSYLAKIIMCEDSTERAILLKYIDKLIAENLVPIRPGRTRPRKNAGNKSRISYRYSY